jgi:hypothetical protein
VARVLVNFSSEVCGSGSSSGGTPVVSEAGEGDDGVRLGEGSPKTLTSASIASREDGEERLEAGAASVSYGCRWGPRLAV